MLRCNRPALLIAPVVLAFAAWVPSIACAQDNDRVVVSIYHVAPGKHLDFLRWQAARRAVLPRASADASAVRVKTATRPAGHSRKAESDDLAHIAGLEARRAAKRTAEEP